MIQGILAYDHTLRRLSDLNVIIRADYELVKDKQVDSTTMLFSTITAINFHIQMQSILNNSTIHL